MSADDKLVERCPNPGCGAQKIVGRPCLDGDCPQQTLTAKEHASALEASEAKIAALTAENDALREERPLADNALVDRYRDPKTGVFSFPTDVAAIVRRLDAAEAENGALREKVELAADDERDRLEAVYRLGVQDTCDMIGPPEDMTYDELTEYGRGKRQVVSWARRELLRPSSGWRSPAARAALRQEGKP